MRKYLRGYRNNTWTLGYIWALFFLSAKIEDCRLETADRIVRYAAVMSVIAWRLCWSVHVNRLAPNAPWSFVLTQIEYHTLWIKIFRKQIIAGEVPRIPPPEKQWSVRECIRSIASLGGFNGRKGDGEPGMQSLWIGWMRLQDMVEVSEVLL